MGKIVIDIKDKSKKHLVVSLLKELPFIEFKELEKDDNIKRISDFRKLFGIWEGREISLNELRIKAWQK